MKQEKADEVGFTSPHVHLPQDAKQADLLAAIRAFNDDPAVDAMLVQHPAPPQIDYEAALLEIDPDKDVDGLHPVNLGRLVLGVPGPVPCTPAGIEALLAYYDVPVAGREVVILGRGFTLGRPLALLLSQKRPTANAAVTVVHTGVPDWPRYTQRADIVVAAAGVPGILPPEHIRPGAVVVGGGVRYEGRKLLPDVDESCEAVAGWITPRLGGVGPDDHCDVVSERGRSSGAPGGSHRVRGMSATAEPLSVPQCTVCGTEVEVDAKRCPACGLARPAARGSQVLGRSGLWMLAAVLLALYGVVLLIVAASALTVASRVLRAQPDAQHTE